MARKRFQEEHENHERWLVSYADFITLLFAFFVVMYAISSVNEGKYRVLSNSLTGAFGNTVNAPPRSGSDSQPVVQLQPLPLIRKPAEAYRRDREQLANVTRDMLAALDPLVQDGKVTVMQTAKGVTIDMNAGVLFAVGDATLAPQSVQVLRAISAVLRVDNHQVQIEGHTDNLPIHNPAFPSNWELSAMRASTVARLLTENGVDERRITAIGQGAKMPVGDNATPDGRAKNRRVTVNVLATLAPPPPDITGGSH